LVESAFEGAVSVVTGFAVKIIRKPTRAVTCRDLTIGAGHPIAVQSMCATHTQDIAATLNQISLLLDHGADVVRVAVDSKKDVEALSVIRGKTNARLVVDLQESYQLIEKVAPYVDGIRYNPGHLHHHEKEIPVREKVSRIVQSARQHSCALRIGVNFGSLDPAQKEAGVDRFESALASAREHVGYMEELGFANYVVSLKSSDPNDVIDINRRFADEFPFIPLHLGVTEAGMLPMGEIKTRVAFENLLAQGIGDTIRVSLTLPFDRKYEEILVGKKIVEDVYAGRFRSVPRFEQNGINIISCPSCSRVENLQFVELAEKVRDLTKYAEKENVTIAVMGCRVNGPGESDDADLGLWCAPKHVNFKRKGELLGTFSYEEIVPRFLSELDKIIADRKQGGAVDQAGVN
jgi:(E)-4-hydroxy-3-methylbut-2-enyl-diphosphate synthase